MWEQSQCLPILSIHVYHNRPRKSLIRWKVSKFVSWKFFAPLYAVRL